ncbi:hypothetical protein [Xanthomonas arboricola]|uniref:Uncharacterized protein n=2 Tax=Xanthomonas arboricola pv. pruni TaxID=69929 RepID=A0AAP4NKL0_9XANT|nr:hypothetical protein [Xanthomonas arboricola]MDN0268165.1 hypothetical protein [Xanthomonas arboricola pv. pruni]MDN0272368.1 hypothetical protein [Xanthomonas arboricola pv. pruni]MDN0276396.1 hypothetical protein [Xanthomonas arboricola pv. pruni]MDN0284549.1 hypothetical protein [Xanthomonas arboricola pv. pruni]MDN0288776.1 hypothetical protein [Xanthomonas arboricola pv. pruni]
MAIDPPVLRTDTLSACVEVPALRRLPARTDSQRRQASAAHVIAHLH